MAGLSCLTLRWRAPLPAGRVACRRVVSLADRRVWIVRGAGAGRRRLRRRHTRHCRPGAHVRPDLVRARRGGAAGVPGGRPQRRSRPRARSGAPARSGRGAPARASPRRRAPARAQQRDRLAAAHADLPVAPASGLTPTGTAARSASRRRRRLQGRACSAAGREGDRRGAARTRTPRGSGESRPRRPAGAVRSPRAGP
jgi:hypothetical protein